MSIVYEALQKARKQQDKKLPRKKGSKTDIFNQLRKMEEQERVALHQAVTDRAPEVSFPFWSVSIKAIASLLLVGGVIFFLSLNRTVVVKEVPVQNTVSSDTVVEKIKSAVLTGQERSSTAQREVRVMPVENAKDFEKNRYSQSGNRFRGILMQNMTQVPDFECTGILGSGREKFAFLNGLIAREGDMIDGARVIQIGQRGVLLDFKGTRLEVPLPEI